VSRKNEHGNEVSDALVYFHGYCVGYSGGLLKTKRSCREQNLKSKGKMNTGLAA
jgi:hypothetical protein